MEGSGLPVDSGGGGAEFGDCCGRREESIRLELEGRLLSLEVKMEENLQKSKEYADHLKECIILRDEKLIAREQELMEKNMIIDEMREEISRNEKKIEELTLMVEKLSVEPKNRVAIENEKRREQRKKISYKPMNLQDIFHVESFDKYFVLSLEGNVKRKISPFKFEADLAKAIGGTPASITSSGSEKFLIEVRTKEQSEKMNKIDRIGNCQCSVQCHTLYSENKGVIYIRNCEVNDFESFRNGLCEEYQLKDVIDASSIKTRNGNRAFILVTNKSNLPEYVHVTGEHTLTKVYPFHETPLQCKKCQAYGHPEKYCQSREPVCRNCAAHHRTDNCTNHESKKCCHCDGSHGAGHYTCPEKIKQVKILEIQKSHKVSRFQASKIMNGQTDEILHNDDVYCMYIKIAAENDSLKKLCPFKLEKFLATKCGVQRNNIRREHNCFIVKSSSLYQTTELCKLTSLLGVPCNVKPHETYNQSRGIIYINGCDVDNDEEFSRELHERYKCDKVERAHWIKCRNERSSAFILTFPVPSPPSSIYIPGENKRTIVYESKPRPLFCKKCLEYSHSAKRCSNDSRCGNCAEPHPTDSCRAQALKCLHCEQPHRTGDKSCKKQKIEEGIVAIKYQERITWPQAKQRYLIQHPEDRQLYADVSKVQTQRAELGEGATAAPPPSNEGDRRARRPRNVSSDEEEEVVTNKRGRTQPQVSEDSDTSEMTVDEAESSETNEKIRKEVLKMFREFEGDPHQDDQQ